MTFCNSFPFDRTTQVTGRVNTTSTECRGGFVLQSAGVRNHNLRSGGTTLRTVGLDFLDDLEAAGNLAENNVLAIEPASWHSGDEKLRSVRVGASISHGQKARLSVFRQKVLIRKFLAIDGPAASTVMPGEITTLKHEPGNHTVETGTLIAFTLRASRKLPEVLCGPGDDTVVQLKLDST